MPINRQSKRRRARTQVRRDSRRALSVCLLFGVAAVAGLGTVIPHMPSISTRMTESGPGHGQGNDDLATGPIIIVPFAGNTCRKKLIDNTTWLIRDEGPVDCRDALARGAHGNQLGWSVSRVDIIRNAFYSR